MKNRFFTPQPETEYYSVSADGRKLPGILPYKGQSKKVLDGWKGLAGIKISPATAQEYIENNISTVLYKRITRCFERHYSLSLKKEQDDLRRD
jgi:hypothetical protein